MKAFVIYLPEKPHSVEHSDYMIETLLDYGLDAEKFRGVPGDVALTMVRKDKRTLYPYSIKSRILPEDEIKDLIRPEVYESFKQTHLYRIAKRELIGDDRDKLSMPGVIGCFYSHYNLWRKCVELDEPIMIFEDDVKFFRGWEPIEWDDVLVLSLGKTSFLKNPWKTYLETPSGNPQPVTWSNFSMPGASGYAIKPKAAKGLIKFYKNYFYPADNAINQFLCRIQVHTYLMGRNTLPEEGNISMTRYKSWDMTQEELLLQEDIE
jgi:GR25 family glycosyltransferase involved in LPS biosynthesis